MVMDILDMCCGSKMFWFENNHPNAVFMDKRHECHALPDRSSQCGARNVYISPMLVADYTHLPFPDNTFSLVVFDPPHFARNGQNGWMAKKYGTRGPAWQEDLRSGFLEGFRVLRPFGVLVFKWNSGEVAISEIVKLSPHMPLIGNKYGKNDKTHWLVFMKPGHVMN